MHSGPKPPVIVIGRNEGEELRRCLSSALRQSETIIYVDSGSSDGSPRLARSLGVFVIELDPLSPYTAARARNEGVHYLLIRHPDVEMVQFLDGDCELADGWLDCAADELAERPELAAVAGNRRERFSDLSIFNKLCDLEWDAPPGEVPAFGGDALVRIAAFRQAGGFNPSLIAGEEPELSLRMRQKGWKILRISRAMSLHDAKMTTFRQWWRRTMRCGHAYAEGAWLYGFEPERHCMRESLSSWFWGAVLPALIIILLRSNGPGAFVIAVLYAVLVLRVYRHMRGRALTPHDALLYAAFCVLAKFPEALGQIVFHSRRFLRRPSRLIEYKAT